MTTPCDKPEILLMRTLQGRTAIVEKKYVNGSKSKAPTYTILMDFPTIQQAQYAKGLMR